MRYFLLTATVVLTLALVAGAAAPAAAESGENSTQTASPSGADRLPNVTVNSPNVTLPNPSQPTPTPTPTPTSETVDDVPDRPNGTAVDDYTTLVRTQYNDDRETVTVVLHSEIRQVITVNDAGALVAGGSGQIPRRIDAVEPGETIRVTLPVTRHEGFVGVAISTDNTLYGHTIAAESDAFERISKTTPQKALLIGVVVALSWVVIAGVSELRREGGEPVVAS